MRTPGPHLVRAIVGAAFGLTPALAQAPCIAVRIDPDPPAASGHFGSRVALSSSWLAVGSFGAPQPAVQIFDLWTGSAVRRLTASNVAPFSGFPAGIDLDDSELVAGGGWPGCAYLFDLATGVERLVLTPVMPISHAAFGLDVAMDGSYVAVGGPGPTHMASGVDGTVHVFDRQSGQELHVLQPSDLVGGWFLEAGFGTSVAISEGLLVGGAPLESSRGSVHVFDLSTGQRRYRIDPGPAGRRFGQTVAAGFGRLVVGDNAANSYAGMASVYELATGTWLYDVTSPQPAASAGFGASVALDGDLLVVGAPYQHVGAGQGAVHVFDAATGAFLHELVGSPPAGANRFGGSLDVRDGVIVVGDAEHSGAATYAGAAFQFAFPIAQGRPYCAQTAPNSTGALGAVRATGCSALMYALTLTAELLPPNQVGAFLVSRTPGLQPGYQGGPDSLCLGHPLGVWRSGAASTGPHGVLRLTIDPAAMPTVPASAVLPGETWYFQAWHRDSTPTATFLMTDALAVSFR